MRVMSRILVLTDSVRVAPLIGAAQLQLIGRRTHRSETERVGESAGAGQVRLLELQPGQVPNLDRRVGRSAAAPRSAPLFAVQIAVSPVMSRRGPRADGDHPRAVIDCSSLPDDEITTDDCAVSQVLMRNPSVLTGTRYDDRTYPHDAAQ